jgi:hypothetical protein
MVARYGRKPRASKKQRIMNPIPRITSRESEIFQADFLKYVRFSLYPKPRPSIEIDKDSTRDNEETKSGKNVY